MTAPFGPFDAPNPHSNEDNPFGVVRGAAESTSFRHDVHSYGGSDSYGGRTADRRRWAEHRVYVERAMVRLGLTVDGTTAADEGACVLHRRCTYGVVARQGGSRPQPVWLYSCLKDNTKDETRREWRTFATLFYALWTGKRPVRLVVNHTDDDGKALPPKGKMLETLWYLRLANAAGFFELADSGVPPLPPGHHRDTLRAVHAGFALWVNLRWTLPEFYGRPAMFGREFVRDWCAIGGRPLSSEVARAAVRDLRNLDVMRAVDLDGHPLRPGDRPAAVVNGRRTHLYVPGEGVTR